MSTLKTWISAFRLRTLPLATAAVLTGMVVADEMYRADLGITLLAWLTAVSLQILSNLANDYGDFVKGTDNEKRIGNQRALQSGNITTSAMLRMIVLFVFICLTSGIGLLWKATGGEINYYFTAFFITGLVAIAAAIKYTVGKNAYGYSGLGDLFVFVFFGPVAVTGTFLLNNGFQLNPAKDWLILFPAISIGLLCAAVLNVNNIRDTENDNASGKFTIPVKIGLKPARVYHLLLVSVALLLMLCYAFSVFHPIKLILVLPALLLINNVRKVYITAPSPAYNIFLKQLSLGTLFLSVCLFLSNLLIKLLVVKEAIIFFSH